ncbi:hydrophobin [Serpula lacrymans var. lacrymans S7.9]|uniref:Hydrophobin n=1 Tax=Serpula lacrymans var. lacrymans (strain S7.9) TaxID=578457 RepID=F8P120_SERL9|nr:hydrophobin [Serpula lacrymans var. lacrymans S7.9]EGO22851.1 hydrophobin [Serpula lacrymans var. lacrymans S7.9]
MFARIYSLFFVLYFSLLALAIPSPVDVVRREGAATSTSSTSSSSSSQCNTGSLQCCESTHSASSVFTASAPLSILAALGGGLLGVNCSPLAPIGVGSGASCAQEPICCSGDSFSGLINVGCSPINVNP